MEYNGAFRAGILLQKCIAILLQLKWVCSVANKSLGQHGAPLFLLEHSDEEIHTHIIANPTAQKILQDKYLQYVPSKS